MKVEIKEAGLKEFALFHPHEANIAEIKVETNVSICLVMSVLFDLSERKYGVYIDDKLTCLFGIVKDEVWLFFEEDVKSLPLSFFKKSKEWFKENNVHGRIYCKNDFAIKWSRFMGFIVEDTGEQFLSFRKEQ